MALLRGRKALHDRRQRVVEGYARELSRMDSDYLFGLVPEQVGFGSPQELATDRDSVRIGVVTFRSESDGGVLYKVVADSGRVFRREYSDGFAVRRGGRIEPLTDHDWEFLA
jgi:hypothetical protein